MQVASVHKYAAYLYINRVFAPLTNWISDAERNNCVAHIINHLSGLKPEDAVFKSTCWPVFIAGAESELPEHRAWVLQWLAEMWKVLPWGYIRSANEVLPMIWRTKDAGQESGSWIHQLRGLGVDFLIA